MRNAQFEQEITTLLRGRFPYIYIVTSEEDRLTQQIVEINKYSERIGTKRTLYLWTVTQGLIRDPYGESPEVISCQGAPQSFSPTRSDQAVRMLDHISSVTEPAIFLLKDFHIYFGEEGTSAGDPVVIRRIRDLLYTLRLKSAPQNVVFTAPVLKLHHDIEKCVTVLDFPLPDYAEIADFLEKMIQANSASGKLHFNLTAEDKERLAKAALGLTLQEAENAFAKAIVRDNTLSAQTLDAILEEKSQAIRRSGVLEYVRSDIRVDQVGGLENLKNWLGKRKNSWLAAAEQYSLPPPKGILITGVPRCGKSLTAKAMSATWQLPLLRLDMGRIFAGLLGSSEQNMRNAIQTAAAVAPCILWIDEIEKGMGSGNSGYGGETAQRVFGTFLTWMQEKKEPVFVIATANNIAALPPEMMRKGRFDEIFFVDLPTLRERVDIFRVHLNKRHRANPVWVDVPITDRLIQSLAEKTEGFSGAEIEQIAVSALFEAYSGSRALRVDDFDRAIRNTVPLSVTQREQIAQLREWADVRAVSASTRDPIPMRTASNDALSAARGGRAVDV